MIDFARVPPELLQGTRAVLWNYEQRNGSKPTKVPRVPHRPAEKASVTDSNTWGSFEDAIAAVMDGKADGIGRVLGDGFTVIDIDGCRDAQTGDITAEAWRIIDELNSYTEISPSDTGVHIWCCGMLPAGRRRSDLIEMYESVRYMTLTGLHLAGTPTTVEERTSELKRLHARTFPSPVTTHHATLDDAELLNRALSAKNGNVFARLWDGETLMHGDDDSAADLALCSHLAFWTGKDAARIDRLFRQSGLMRQKWDEHRGRQTYGEKTIERAIQLCRDSYASASNGSSRKSSSPSRVNGSQLLPESAIEPAPVLVPLADVQPESVEWIWPGRVAVGKIALICGDPGLGKSWITLDVAARMSSGRGWPDGAPAAPTGNVLLLSAEDALADTIRPRLDALGADVTRITHLPFVRAGDKQRAVQLSDIGIIDEAIRRTNARLVVIDPISAYLGSTDSHRDSDVRGLIAPLAALAEGTGVAVVGVMHLAKSTQRPAIYRAVGSIAFTAAARIVLAVAADPDRDDRRILASVKCNISAPAMALAYTLGNGQLSWESGPVSNLDVEALLSGPPLDRHERREVDDWLRQLLTNGPLDARQIKRAAEQAGFAWRTVFRAKQRLGIDAVKLGFGPSGKWTWMLPDTKTATRSTTDNNVAAFDKDHENSPVSSKERQRMPAESLARNEDSHNEQSPETDEL
jgi:hypothetical protein